MRFFEAAANWADQRSVDVKFARDDMDGWFALLSFQDARGPYSATVDEMVPRGKSKRMVGGEKIPVPAETEVEFEERVAKAMSSAAAAAHAKRIIAITKTKMIHHKAAA